MAVAVDKAEFLLNEVFKVFGNIRDVLAIIGSIYAAQRLLTATQKLYSAVKVYGIANISKQNFVRNYGKWALVTGCTGGIGQAYCTELAARGMNVILVGRNESKLSMIASNLEETFKVETLIIPVDFNDGAIVYDKIKQEIQGKEIGILLNNVGVMYEYPQLFLDVPEEKLWQLVNVNVAAATIMTKMILPQMVERNKGAIVTVASGASTIPTPQMTVYSATKAYLDYFMRALAYEYRNSGVTIQCLMPFYVATRMTQYSSTLSNPSLLIPTATTYARSALATLGWSSRTTGYLPHTLQFWFAQLVPESLWMWGATKLNNALRRQADKRIRHRSGSASRLSSSGSRSGSQSGLRVRSRPGSEVFS